MTTTAEQQLALELINRARANPAGEFDALITDAANQEAVQSNITSAVQYFDVDLDLFLEQISDYDAVDPLAWNTNLAISASTHTDLMILHDEQSHFTPGEVGVGQRMQDAGYDNMQTGAESIFAFSKDVTYAHAGFYIDWGFGTGGMQDPAGHRDAILSDNYTEVGIDWTAETDQTTDVGPYLTTQHFGTRFNYEAQLLGVVIDDLDDDDFYDIGEGLEGITIEASGQTGTFVTYSWASGGYQLVLPDGIYTVSFSGDGIDGSITQEITIAGANVKLDAHAGDAVGAPDPDPDPESEPEGDLSLIGGTGTDTLAGGDGEDELYGLQGDDNLQGGGGRDEIWGASGDDTIYGGTEDDTLRGGPDEDYIDGGDGNDNLSGQKHSDTLYGGDGDDIVKGGGGNDMLDGGAGNDFLKGGTRFDVISGGSGDDTIYGNAHDDTLSGDAGADTLNGGGGDDQLTGGSGDDDLKGGDGADVFIFDVGHDADMIRNFDASQDTLQISVALADGLSAEQIAASAVQVSGGITLDFGDGDTINFVGLSALDAEAIDII